MLRLPCTFDWALAAISMVALIFFLFIYFFLATAIIVRSKTTTTTTTSWLCAAIYALIFVARATSTTTATSWGGMSAGISMPIAALIFLWGMFNSPPAALVAPSPVVSRPPPSPATACICAGISAAAAAAATPHFFAGLFPFVPVRVILAGYSAAIFAAC